jgi:hypothetical protein
MKLSQYLQLIYYYLQVCIVYIECYTKMACIMIKSNFRISWMYIELYREYIYLCTNIIINRIMAGFLYLQIWMIRLYVYIRRKLPNFIISSQMV